MNCMAWRKFLRGAAMGLAILLTVAAIGVLLLAAWAPALMGAPGEAARPRWHFNGRPAPVRH